MKRFLILYQDTQDNKVYFQIVNCDSIAYNQYVNSLNNRESQKNELNKIKQDIDEIKLLLKEIINESK